MGRTGAFIGGLLGLPAGVLLGTLLSSGTRSKEAKGKWMIAAASLGGVAGAVIGAGCTTCTACPTCPAGTTPTCPPGTVFNVDTGRCEPVAAIH